ncbi:hypothetical protein AMTRI_Chr12g234170 [Amborella trichopoda]
MVTFQLFFSLEASLLFLSMVAARPTIFPIKWNSPAPLSMCDPLRYLSMGLDMNKFSFCNKSLSYSIRAKDLVKRMTLTKKVYQLGSSTGPSWFSNVGLGTHFNAKIIPGATCLPNVILTTTSHGIDVVRDPRWGHTLETPDEDLYTVGRYATSYMTGLQDVKGTVEKYADDLASRLLKVASCYKHYATNDVIERDKVETLVRPLDMCIKDGDVSGTYSAIQQGKISELDVDKVLVNLYVMLLRLDFFDGQPPYISLGKDDVCNESNLELAAEAAREGIVILKNRDTTLPLDVNTNKKIVVIGNNANATDVTRGNYARLSLDTSMFEDAVCASKTAYATILVMGLDTQIEVEGRDRNDIFLPGQQAEVINRIPMTSMPLRPLPNEGYAGRTYKFFTGQSIYPIGYSMSYSYFNYTFKSIPDVVDLSLGQNQLCHRVTYIDDALTRPPSCASILVFYSSGEIVVEFEVMVNNLGHSDGSHVALVYDVTPVGLEAIDCGLWEEET